MEFFRSEKLSEQVTKITDLAGVYAYLVEGKHTVALIDTCCGAGDLKAFVESLTDKPVIVLCTHGHLDHAGGAYGFDAVYLNEKDYELVREHSAIEFRKGYVDGQVAPGLVSLADYVPARTEFENLNDGQLFELGGIALEACALPGHTAGMMCILVRELRVVLLGDACNSVTFLFLPEACSVEDYKNYLLQFLKHEDKYDSVWFSHGHNLGEKSILHEAIALCDEIMSGRADNVPFDFMGNPALLAKAVTPNLARVDGKTANIVFNPGKVMAG